MKKYTERKDGRYSTNVWDGSYKNGKKRYICVMADSSAKLEQKVRAVSNKREEGMLVVRSDITLREYADQWLIVNKSVREKNTQDMYRNIIERKLDIFGAIPVAQLTHTAIQGKINELQKSPRICQIFLLTMKQILRSAEKDKIIGRGQAKELLDDLQLPKYKAKERRVLTEEEKKAILAADFSGRERCLVYLLYYCGLRRQEALALTRFDINFQNDTITINKALAFDKNSSYIKSTKTEHGIRTIPMPQNLAKFLKGYISTLNGSELICGAAGEARYLTHSMYKWMWGAIQAKMEAAYIKSEEERTGEKKNHVFYDWDKVGIRSLTAHIFRHNYCTMLCYEAIKTGSISTKKIAEMLGDTEQMVIKVYSHLLEENEKPRDAISSALAL